MPGGICTGLLTADAASSIKYRIMYTTTNYLLNNINTILVSILTKTPHNSGIYNNRDSHMYVTTHATSCSYKACKEKRSYA